MSALHAIIILAVFAAAVWAILTYSPMNAALKRAIIILAIICAVVWIMDITGILGDAKAIKVPQLN